MMTDDPALPATAQEWLARWDAGEPVWSVNATGLGHLYEIKVHVIAAEALRDMLAKQYDHSAWGPETATWLADWVSINEAIAEITTAQQASTMHCGAAMSLATSLFMRGPAAVHAEALERKRTLLVRRPP